MTLRTPAGPRLTFNGVNGATGTYGLPPMTGEELARAVRGEEKPENFDELRARLQQTDRHLGVREGVDPSRLDEAGWGVIFAQNTRPEIREALQPLLDLRREQAGDLYKVYEMVPGESKSKFLARHGVGPGPADPARVPYYLLLVGSPEAIPYRFQSQLDVQYAVGRIHFDGAEDYARYAGSVVAAESGKVRRPRRMSFFGVENPDDEATRLSTHHLVTPLLEHLQRERPDWQASAFLRGEATKTNLGRLLDGESPALLFTASHGLEFPLGDPRQRPHQGALLCGDWPGPRDWTGPVPQDFYFAADDLDPAAGLHGLVSFHFACYGAGTPRLDELSRRVFEDRAAIAPEAFLAALPQALLSHPRGGALAVIGHVERAWGYSFLWEGAGAQTAAFESALTRLLDGHPVGSALEYLNERYAELSTQLADQLDEIEFGVDVDPNEIAGLWTANNDARGYVILGDPAVRLPVAAPGEAAEARPETTFRSKAVDFGAEAFTFSVGTKRRTRSRGGDEVHVSAWHPRALAVGASAKLLVYAHLLATQEAVERDAGQVLGKAAVKDYRPTAPSTPAIIAPGTEILIVPEGKGLRFDPPRAMLRWQGDWQRADFTMTATEEKAGHVVEGSIACYVGPLLIASLRLPVVVPRPGAPAQGPAEPALASQSARTYQAVFASYSHDDKVVVEGMEKACKALGMDYLRDVMTLRSGQRWSDELLEMIEKADIFQLFWSTPASESPYVEQEWRHALGLETKKEAFIRPICWEDPMPPVPDPLRHLHFAPFDLPGFAPLVKTAPPEPVVPLLPDGTDLTLLTVSTWAATDPADPATGRLKARTRIDLDGEVESHLSSDPADAHHLAVHEKMVAEALRARLAYLELLGRKGGGNR